MNGSQVFLGGKSSRKRRLSDQKSRCQSKEQQSAVGGREGDGGITVGGVSNGGGGVKEITAVSETEKF